MKDTLKIKICMNIHEIRRIVCYCWFVHSFIRLFVRSFVCSLALTPEELVALYCVLCRMYKCTIHRGMKIEAEPAIDEASYSSDGNNGTQIEMWQRRSFIPYSQTILCFKSMTNHHSTSLHQNKSVH